MSPATFYLFSLCMVSINVFIQCTLSFISLITSKKSAGKWFLGKYRRSIIFKNDLMTGLYIVDNLIYLHVWSVFSDVENVL